MALDTTQMWGAVDPVVRKFYGLEKSKRKAEFSQIFDVSKGKEAVRHSMEFGGPGQLALKAENGPINEMTIRQGQDKTWLYAVYAGQITMSYELARDVNYRAIKTVSGNLGRATALTPEYLGAQFLDRGFNTSYPATADGKPIFSASHLIVGTNGSTGSNLLATPAAFAESSAEDLRTQAMTMPGPDGMIDPVTIEQWVVPAALANFAEKLSGSSKTLGSANNDPSVVNKIKPMVFRFLGSNTRWMAQTDKANGLFWEWDQEAEFMEDNSITTLQKVYVAFFRARWGIDDWRSILGVAAT
jgi:hypothetical protein